MEKFRCPTCLTMLEGGEQRCPACRSRLRKRGRPIVLGDASRITSRALLPLELNMHKRVEASNAPGHPWHVPHISLATHSATAEPGPREPQPEPVDASVAFEPTVTLVPAPTPTPVDIDLTTVAEDMYEIFGALHRKARAEPDYASGPYPWPDPSDSTLDASTSRDGRRRRLARRPRSDPGAS